MSSIVLCCITLHLAASLAAESRNQAWEVLKDEALREEYDRKWREIMEPAVLADECRRAGNELYRAACLLAQKHADAHGDGVTFGGEGAIKGSGGHLGPLNRAGLDWAKQALEKYHLSIDAYSRGPWGPEMNRDVQR